MSKDVKFKPTERQPKQIEKVRDTHSRWLRRAFVPLLVATLALPLFPTQQPLASPPPERGLSQRDQRLLELAARKLGIEISDLELLNSTTISLPLTEHTISAAKISRRDRDELVSIAIDSNDNEVDVAALRQDEEKAHKEKYGKLDPFLHDRAQAMRGGDKIKVAFWLKHGEDLDGEDERKGRTDLTEEDVETLIARREDQLRRATANATGALKSALGRAKFRVDEASLTSPVVYATIPVRALPALAQRADVEKIYFADNVNEDYMNIAAQSVYANYVWDWYGFTGSGARVAIVEDSRVDFDNNCLVTNLGTRVPGDANVDQHATTTAGMVASNHATVRGIAYGAGIYSANGTTYSDANMSAALDAGATNAHILNNSWGPNCGSADGSMNVHARHADYIVRYRWDTVVAAAGNNGACAGFEFVGGVATGYNVIAVGNFDDNDTATFADDFMNSGSSYKDPTSAHGDREKPEVAAPGTDITSLLLAAPGTCPTGGVGSGTSYSSPMVAGIAALLMHAQPSLKLYPETVKALILSGATHNIEGSARLSDKDGAGGVNALASYSNAANGRYRWLYVTPTSFDASGYITVDMGFIPAGTRVKVALVWDSNPSGDYSTDTLRADLDLNVTGPGVSYWSSSWDNSYEVVDFNAPSAGTYTLRIKNYRFDGASEYVAVAWKR